MSPTIMYYCYCSSNLYNEPSYAILRGVSPMSHIYVQPRGARLYYFLCACHVTQDSIFTRGVLQLSYPEHVTQLTV